MKFKLLGILLLIFITGNVFAQTILSGKVLDKTFGDALTGANVYIMNADNRALGGVMVDFNGEYHVRVPNQPNLSIVISFIGYKTQKVKYTGQTKLDISLEEESQAISAVEVVAKKAERNEMGLLQREIVGATQKMTMEGLETAPVTDVTEALQGAMSNVDILTNAEPGVKSQIRIRGTSSLNANTEPLIVIDGVPYPADINDDFDFSTANSDDYGALLNISPTDIESIEVLKDAAATAVWGSKGANGVLLINTKRGSKGKIQFSFSSKYELSKERNTIPLLNASQYVSMIQDAIWNTVNDIGYSGALNYVRLLYDTKEIGYDPEWQYFNEYNVNTNWVDEVTQTGFSVDNSFSMSGGGDKATYRFSLSHLAQDGTTIGTGFQRIGATFNMRYVFSNRLDISTNYQFTQSVRDTYWEESSKRRTPRSVAINRMPNQSPYYINEDGSVSSQYFTPWQNFQGSFDSQGIYNPTAMVHESKNNTTSYTNAFTFNLHYNLLKGFDYYGLIGLRASTNRTDRFLPSSVTGVPWTSDYYNVSSMSSSDNLYMYTENKLIYNWQPAEGHKVLGTALLTTDENVRSALNGEVSGKGSSSMPSTSSGGNIKSMSSSRLTTRSVGVILNAHYSLLQRYMFNVGYRLEGNSTISPKTRWGWFPTVGVAWQMGDEAFMENLDWISTSKVRASWGQSGNTPSGASLYMGRFSPITPGYGDMTAIFPSTIQLDNLKWETVSKSNAGVDIGLLNDKVMMAVDVYRNVTTDLLRKKVTVPSTTGYSSISYFNSGKMTNDGWEFRIDWNVLRTKKWGLTTSFNISQNFNKVNSLPNSTNEDSYNFGNTNYAYKVVEGDPLGSFYGYKYLGVYQNVEDTYARDSKGSVINDINGKPVVSTINGQKVYPGDAKYGDMNGDGVIDKYDIVYLGNSMPTLTGGFNFNLRYGGWGLIANFHGRAGQKIVNSARMSMENMYGNNNQSTAVLRRWRNEGDDTDIPRALYNRGYNYLGSDRFVEDGSFLRLKTLTIRYKLPTEITRKAKLTGVDLYLTGYDLFTITKYTGQDPEVALSYDSEGSGIYMLAKDNAQTPKAMRFAAGINLKF